MKSLNDLKAEAYDIMAQMDYLQRRLHQVNQTIANYKLEVSDESKKD